MAFLCRRAFFFFFFRISFEMKNCRRLVIGLLYYIQFGYQFVHQFKNAAGRICGSQCYDILRNQYKGERDTTVDQAGMSGMLSSMLKLVISQWVKILEQNWNMYARSSSRFQLCGKLVCNHIQYISSVNKMIEAISFCKQTQNHP